MATLLFDLLLPAEAASRSNVFDIDLLANRLLAATAWLRAQDETRRLGLGYFGASTGAAAALVAAARRSGPIGAVVSRGGRPDLAGAALAEVRAPTLLIVGGDDRAVLDLNRAALERLQCEKRLEIIPTGGPSLRRARRAGYGHRPCPRLVRQAPARGGRSLMFDIFEHDVFPDRTEAGRRLAERLQHLKDQQPVVLALPRGGVPVAYEVARVLEAPLDLVLVRKIGAPFQPELAIGAVVDGERPELVLNRDLITEYGIPESYVEGERRRQLAEIERRREQYLAGRARAPVQDRTAIVIDDGIATGATMEAALHATRRAGPRRLVLAVPVAPPDTIERLRPEVDEVVCVQIPAFLGAIGSFYRDFRQLRDEDVIGLLEAAAAWTGSAPCGPRADATAAGS